MRVSAIDIGSNTVRLLVADVAGAGTWQVVDEDQTITRLGARPGPLLPSDTGGGSREYVLSENDAIRSMVSLRLGATPLAERFPFPAAIDGERSRALEDGVRAQLAPELPAAIRTGPVAHL